MPFNRQHMPINEDPKISNTGISRAIQSQGAATGFCRLWFCQGRTPAPKMRTRLRAWLDAGHHARMGYMANHFEKRTDPTRLVEGARSVISLLFNYYTDKVQKDPSPGDFQICLWQGLPPGDEGAHAPAICFH
jgi:hypothetical protein